MFCLRSKLKFYFGLIYFDIRNLSCGLQEVLHKHNVTWILWRSFGEHSHLVVFCSEVLCKNINCKNCVAGKQRQWDLFYIQTALWRSDSYCSAKLLSCFSLYLCRIIHSSCPICSVSHISTLSAPQWAIRQSSDSCAFVHLSIMTQSVHCNIFSAERC